jgi:hypothetical protein
MYDWSKLRNFQLLTGSRENPEDGCCLISDRVQNLAQIRPGRPPALGRARQERLNPPTPRRSNPSGSAWSSSQFRPSGHASLGSTSQA